MVDVSVQRLKEAGTPGARPVRAPSRLGRALRLILFAILILAVVGGGQWVGSWLATSGPSAVPAGTSSAQPSTTPASAVAPTPTSTPRADAKASQSPVGTPLVHVVVLNENLSAIAKRYGVTVEALRAANEITDPNLIVVGQRLIIPVP